MDNNKLKESVARLESIIAGLVETKQILAAFTNLHAQTIAIMGELVELNNAEVDAILMKHGIVITGKNGERLFPRENKDTYPKIIYEN